MTAAYAALITPQVQRLRDDHGLYPYTAAEIEFSMHGSAQSTAVEACYAEIRKAAEDKGIDVAHIGKEDGPEQHEISIKPCNDPVKTAHDTELLKHIIAEVASQHSLKADFSAKPSADQPGNGLHIHIHLADADGKNMYYKDDDRISDELNFSIGGLLHWMHDSMAVFAPSPHSYDRFIAGKTTPLCVSWGANNRSCAIRLPQAEHDKKHIEHRVSGADANTGRVIAIILAAMHYGIANKNEPGPQIYGDASLPVYKLPKLLGSLDTAAEALRQSQLVAGYFTVSDLLPNH
jgi:glutamine synthetase